MILLDTNVVSELMRAQPNPAVLDWFAAQRRDAFYISAITEAELRTGAAILPDGARKTALEQAINDMVAQEFDARVLPFDSAAAKAYAQIARDRRAAGRPISEADCQIAAIARAKSGQVATRNTADFEGCGVKLVNPWNAV